jgi:hypothetical protein
MDIKLICKKKIKGKIELGKQYLISLYGRTGRLSQKQNIYCISRKDGSRIFLIYEEDIDEFFISLAEWREQQINSILND